MSEADPADVHVPVMPEQSLAWMAIEPGMTVLDGTLGMGGHSALFAQAAGAGGHLIGLDRDPKALSMARVRLQEAPCPVTFCHKTYSEMEAALRELSIQAVDRIFLDIGVSSLQLDDGERGFSFRFNGPLDMRMNPEDPESAADVIRSRTEAELADIFYYLGEERYSRRIAKRIVAARASETINTTEQLAKIVEQAVPRRGRIHPATRVFQALRIAVNDELGELERGLEAALRCLRPQGRLVLITFHSLEDRIAKRTMRKWAEEGKVNLPVRKVVKPSREECLTNRRARSAKLRVCEVL